MISTSLGMIKTHVFEEMRTWLFLFKVVKLPNSSFTHRSGFQVNFGLNAGYVCGKCLINTDNTERGEN